MMVNVVFCMCVCVCVIREVSLRRRNRKGETEEKNQGTEMAKQEVPE